MGLEIPELKFNEEKTGTGEKVLSIENHKGKEIPIHIKKPNT